jgi:hypothetical protein
LKTSLALRSGYSYEEFADHLTAMRMVRSWEYTSRFGHVGSSQTSRANNARVVEYFSDSYQDQKEAVLKAELFLSICDYIGRHAGLFISKKFIDKLPGGQLVVEPALLRAIHHVFSSGLSPTSRDPRRILMLAKAFEEVRSSE